VKPGGFQIFVPALKGLRSLSLHRQLRSAVEVAIGCGEIQPGTPLPSVRQLASRLGISEGTVFRAYEELVAEGIVSTRNRKGYFVAIDENAIRPAHRMQDLVDEAVQAAASSGIDASRFLEFVAERARTLRLARRRVAVVGYTASLDERVSMVSSALDRFNVETVGLSYEALTSAERGANASPIEAFLVPLLETRFASDLLGSHAHRIIPMTLVVKPDVRDFIQQQPPDTRFGLVAHGHQFVGRLVAGVARLHPLRVPPLTASATNEQAVRELLGRSEVAIIGALARPLVKHLEPLGVPNVGLVYVPDPDTIERLESRLH